MTTKRIDLTNITAERAKLEAELEAWNQLYRDGSISREAWVAGNIKLDRRGIKVGLRLRPFTLGK